MRDLEFYDRQLEALSYLDQSDDTNVVCYGGQAQGGKSWLACMWAVSLCLMFLGIRIGMARKTLKDLKESTLITLIKVFNFLGLREGINYKIDYQGGRVMFMNPKFKKEIDRFKGGSVIVFVALEYRPSDPDATFLGGYEFAVGVIEEIGEVTKRYFEIFFTRCGRQPEILKKAKLFVTCNPVDNWVKTYFYTRHIKKLLPAHTKFVNTVGSINPFRSENYSDGLKLLSERDYERLENGNWDYNTSKDQLFDHDKIEGILTGLDYIDDKRYISADIARYGEDTSVVCVWYGMKIVEIQKYSKQSLVTTADCIKNLMNKHKVTRDKVVVDSDGVGGGVEDILKCKGIHNNGKPFKNEKYNNVKSQLYFKLSKTDWSIDDSIREDYLEEIRKELSAVRDKSDDSHYKINTKDEQKMILGGKSPDFSDAIMLRMSFEYKVNEVTFMAV